jgi:phage terminase small subunit
MKETKLTLKQQAFCDYYIETGNATESYKRAYNSTDNTANVEGHRNLSKPSIKAYIDERMKLIENKRIASAEEVLQYLTSVVRGEVTEQKILFSKEGSEIAELGASVNDRNKAAELLGKRYALFTDKKQLEGNIGITIVDDIDEED